MRSSSCRDAWLFGCTGPHGVHDTNLDGARLPLGGTGPKEHMIKTSRNEVFPCCIISRSSLRHSTCPQRTFLFFHRTRLDEYRALSWSLGIASLAPSPPTRDALPHAAMRGGTAAILSCRVLMGTTTLQRRHEEHAPATGARKSLCLAAEWVVVHS